MESQVEIHRLELERYLGVDMVSGVGGLSGALTPSRLGDEDGMS
jgi:hypothetical protein